MVDLLVHLCWQYVGGCDSSQRASANVTHGTKTRCKAQCNDTMWQVGKQRHLLYVVWFVVRPHSAPGWCLLGILLLL